MKLISKQIVLKCIYSEPIHVPLTSVAINPYKVGGCTAFLPLGWAVTLLIDDKNVLNYTVTISSSPTLPHKSSLYIKQIEG